jgi:NAD(P)-dependent dehydrogenase (short-subunit alcohol dehydrogenase family)
LESFRGAKNELGDSTVYIESDAADASNQKHVAERVEKELGKLDILFVNAGVAELKPFEQWDEAAYDRSFATNVRGPFFLIQALLPVFASPASIILNASINAHIGMANTSVYGSTKAALLSLARTLSGELISRGVRVNAVSPGPIATPLYGKLGFSATELQATADAIKSQVPAKRFGTPSEIASAVVFLGSDESAFTVGSELIIDGGLGL